MDSKRLPVSLTHSIERARTITQETPRARRFRRTSLGAHATLLVALWALALCDDLQLDPPSPHVAVLSSDV